MERFTREQSQWVQWMRLTLLCFVIVLSIVLAVTTQPANKSITDLSWPNCGSRYLQTYTAGIVGVTGGLDFRINPCASSEAHMLIAYALYANTGYPGYVYGRKFANYPKHCTQKDYVCFAYNYGYAAGLFAIRAAAKSGVVSRLWFLDVETENSWTYHPAVNRAELSGEMAAISQYTFLFSGFGIYSTSHQWQIITGGWKNMLPEWLGTGSFDQRVATKACRDVSFTGGRIWLSQYTAKLDINVTCNLAAATYFPTSFSTFGLWSFPDVRFENGAAFYSVLH
jgi:hypothetical protein